MALRPLIITANPDLLDDLLRLTAAAGLEAEVARDPIAARDGCESAPLVLLGADQLVPWVRAGRRRRSGIVIVARGPVPAHVWDLATTIAADHIAQLPIAEEWLVERLVKAAEAPPPAPAGRTVAVLGGRGGAGASTLATGLAVTAARRGLRAMLVDADPLGGGLDLVLGWEKRTGLRWPALAEAPGPVDPPALIDALPSREELVLLSFARDELPAIPPESMFAVLDAARITRDLTVVDAPRRIDDAAAVALSAADEALLVVPAEVRAVAAAARVATVVQTHCAALSLVVRGPSQDGLRAREVARTLGLPLAGSLRPEDSLSAGVGVPGNDGRGSLTELCRRLLPKLVDGAQVAA